MFFQNTPVNQGIPSAEAKAVYIHIRRDVRQKRDDGA